ncbi:MAG: tRNA uridine-5-carboxymethylaminomethyl(34) synthesis enzyme MnmG, partial [Sphingobacteriales bacterium]
LQYSLETKGLENLFFAGQINGTTGYEEAACQGLMAGINAHLKVRGDAPLILKRSEAYIGVLIDDLISKGTQEPYRMFTSRAEFRTLLRQDNADLRLTELSYRMGLASEERMQRVIRKRNEVASIKEYMGATQLEPAEINPFFEEISSAAITEKQKLDKIILRPNVQLESIRTAVPRVGADLETFDPESREQAEIQVKYQVYINKERELVERMSQMETLAIPEQFDYHRIQSLGIEAREKLSKVRPQTLGQASRISGINPSDIQILMVFMGR